MPVSQRQKIYWDSCVWLSYINAIADRLPILDGLLADSASEHGNIEIYASSLSQVEVAFAAAEQLKQALDSAVEEKIDQLWADRDTVKLIEYHDGIGREARRLMRLAITRSWQLKPYDAIHLATAKAMQVAEFHTYDKDLSKFADDVGVPITQPHTMMPRML